MLLGVIADDFTGATDIASFLVENGMQTVQLNGVPDRELELLADAVVISLKSRSCPDHEAVKVSLHALDWLQSQGCEQFYFKYCSTFDSTQFGNIGPVTDALLEQLGETFTVVCPALPVNGRTLFNGHLFVMGQLLSDSGMRHHPVTPMTDANIVRLMNKQSKGRAELVNFQIIEQGTQAVIDQFEHLQQQGFRYAVVDAFNESHLMTLGQACKNMKLVTGGSGLAIGIAQNWPQISESSEHAKSLGYPESGKTVVLSGSCSQMTNCQVNHYKSNASHFALDVSQCFSNPNYHQEIADWVMAHIEEPLAPIVYATADIDVLHTIQNQYGANASSQAVEHLFSQLSQRLKQLGVRNYIVAGGETSGIVTQSLNVEGFYIGPQIAAGVPWVKSLQGDFSLALKSGNFGDEQFFTKAQEFMYD